MDQQLCSRHLEALCHQVFLVIQVNRAALFHQLVLTYQEALEHQEVQTDQAAQKGLLYLLNPVDLVVHEVHWLLEDQDVPKRKKFVYYSVEINVIYLV